MTLYEKRKSLKKIYQAVFVDITYFFIREDNRIKKNSIKHHKR